MNDQDPQKKLEEIDANYRSAEGDPSKVMTERAEAHMAARQAIIDLTVEAYGEKGDSLSKEAMEATERATDLALEYLYEVGNPDGKPEQRLRNFLEARRSREADSPQKSWEPKTEAEFKHVVSGILLASYLGGGDGETAYGPARQEAGGRRHEILDGPTAKYNKFGFLITYGMRSIAAAKRTIGKTK